MPNGEKKSIQLALSTDFKIIVEDNDPYKITYKGSVGLPIHRWVRLTPSFSPQLVSRLLREFKCDHRSKVLDPFMGIGTTVLQCQFEGFESVGVDINPFLHYVATMKTSLWQESLAELRNGAQDFVVMISEKRKEAMIPLEDFPKTLGVEVPRLHNITRWWRVEVLKDLLIGKHILKSASFDEETKEFLKMGLISILMDVANVTYEGVQFTFKDRSKEDIDVVTSLRKCLCEMVDDVEYFQQNVHRIGRTSTIRGDSTRIAELLKDCRPTCVITSPPYPNRYSYVWNTRPYLYFFDFITEANEASELDKQAIGGTWGKATSDLVKGEVAPLNADVANIVEETIEKIRSKNALKNTNLMANYIMKYFNMMYDHATSLEKILAKNAELAYVIGNSEIKGVEIPADIWLGKIFEECGLAIDRIVRVRRRHSGKGLYESVVIGKCP